MRLALVSVAVLVMAVTGATGSAMGQIPTEDSVVGSAQVSHPDEPHGTINFQFDAHSGPSGENPTGGASFETPGIGGAGGPVFCLTVAGNRATVGVVSLITFQVFFFFVEDNDGAGQDLVALTGADPNSHVCPEPVHPSDPITAGDITVTDAHPLPTSKHQCQAGGWRDFPQFKNQGQCVRFVRHQARQQCVFERVAHGRTAFVTRYGQGPHKRRPMHSCVLLRMNG
jgi:hypothetical protein